MSEQRREKAGDLRADLKTAVAKITDPWRKEKLHRERVSRERLQRFRYPVRSESVRDAAFAVMEQAYSHASGNGEHYANARQIMYSARPLVLERTEGKCWKNSQYFTQTLLKDYLDRYEPDWADRVVWDARGQLHEPHTDTRVPLGGLGVMRHLREWTDGQVECSPEALTIPRKLATCGPAMRYGAAVFIEKEGFAPILEHMQFAERHDAAVLSTKGVSTGAACKLVHELHAAGVPVFVVRDFDLAGFKIVRTLRKGTRRAPGTPVIDLGLRLADVETLGLQREQVSYNQRADPRRYLRECGATEAEADVLVTPGDYWRGWSGERVELNAMTSPQFIAWLEGKLAEHEVKKVRPEGDVLQAAYERAVRLQAFERKIEGAKKEFWKGDLGPCPEGLGARIDTRLKCDPALPWEVALWEEIDEAE